MFVDNTEELAQNKLLLLYLINNSDKSLSNNDITEFMLEKNYMNYFLVQQFLSELLDSDLVEVEGDKDKEVYSITKKGIIALSYFEDRILDEFKNDVNLRFAKSVKEQKIETEVVSEFYLKENNQYVVNLKLVENEDILFSMYLDVSNEKQAKKIAVNWKENTDQIYLNIINTLTSNNIDD